MKEKINEQRLKDYATQMEAKNAELAVAKEQAEQATKLKSRIPRQYES